MNTLTVIVPFFNEESTLAESLDRLIKSKIATEILLFDDCSNDKSLEIAQTYENNFTNIKVYKAKTQSGKGAAIKSLQYKINTTHVAIHDADLEYNPFDLLKMFEVAKNYPDSLVLGSRFIGGEIRENRYRSTYIANNLLSFIFSLINQKKVTDIASCYKLFSSGFFKNLNLNENGFSIEVEILSKFLKTKKNIYEVPISYFGRTFDEGKKIKFKDSFKFIISMIRYRFFN